MNQVKCKVVMLPTEKADSKYIAKCIKPSMEEDRIGDLFFGDNDLFVEDYNNNRNVARKCFETQHLYILSDEEIKENDWYYSKGKTIEYSIYQADNKRLVELANGSTGQSIGIKKIIASTDKSLGLPRPSDSFIKKYCELGGIDEVMVDYNTFEWYDASDTKILKVAPDNTITIHPVVEKTYTREDMRKIALYFKAIGGNEKNNCWLSHHNDMVKEYLENL